MEAFEEAAARKTKSNRVKSRCVRVKSRQSAFHNASNGVTGFSQTAFRPRRVPQKSKGKPPEKARATAKPKSKVS
jgi:hypothetical protein